MLPYGDSVLEVMLAISNPLNILNIQAKLHPNNESIGK